MQNKDTFAATYSQSFKDAYPDLPVELAAPLIEKALKTALENLDAVNIDGAAFTLACKRLGIKHTKKAIKEYLAA